MTGSGRGEAGTVEGAVPWGEASGINSVWRRRGSGALVSPAVGLPSAGSSALADAAALGLSALAEVLTRAEDGICVVDVERRYVYANPTACQMLGLPVEELRGRDFLGSFPAREHATVLGHLPRQAPRYAAWPA